MLQHMIIEAANRAARGGGAASSFAVLNSAGTSFTVPTAVLDSSGNSFTVPTSALDSAGTSYSVGA